MHSQSRVKGTARSDNVTERSSEEVLHRSVSHLETVAEGKELESSGITMEERNEKSNADGKDGSTSLGPVEVRVTKGDKDGGKDLEDSELEDQVFENPGRLWHASRSLSPLVAAESLEDYDLPPQLMMCRRNSATFISIPRTLHQPRPHYERCDTAPPFGENFFKQQKGLLQKSHAVGGLEGSPEGRHSTDLTSPLGCSRRTSASHVPFQSHLSVDIGNRLSRSHDDLTLHHMRSGRKRTHSPLGSPHRRRHGAGMFHPSFISLDVPRSQTEDEDSYDDEHDASPIHRRRRKSSTTVIHRQSSGMTLCVPLQHSLNVSPVETEEEDVDEASTDEPSWWGNQTSTTVFHRRASGVTHCYSLNQSMDLSDHDHSIDVDHASEDQHHTHVQYDRSPSIHPGDMGDDEADLTLTPGHDVTSGDGSFSMEDLPSPGTRSLQKKGSIAIPLERCLDRLVV